MKAVKIKTFFLICLLSSFNLLLEFSFGSNGEKAKTNLSTHIKGITVVAPPKAIGAPAFQRLKEINAEWVSFVPYGFTKKGSTDIRYNLDRQWWGEKTEGLETCIIEAKKQGIKVMVKPQVFMGNGWIGEMDFETEEKWKTWEINYKRFLMEYLAVAIKQDVEMFCIGTELNIAMVKREIFWRELIKEIRQRYKGQITYSANWDSYEKVGVWKDLDFVGISSYFPLSDAKNPTVGLLVKEWKPIVRKLKAYSAKQNKKILFTEYGYMSVDGCAGKAWEIEKSKHNLNINYFAQSNAYDALWTSLINEDFWAGGFLWKWFPEGMGHEGYPEKDYSPQDKPAEKVIKKWFTLYKKI